MVMQNKILIYAQINSQYASNTHVNKQLFNSENWSFFRCFVLFQIN